jgi:hypothetical protein
MGDRGWQPYRRGYAPSSKTTDNQPWGVMKYIFYAALAILAIFLLSLLLKSLGMTTFTLNTSSGAIVTLPGATGTPTTAYITSAIPPYLSTRFANVVQTGYTVSFDAYMGSSQNTGAIRVLFSNGSTIREPSKPMCTAPNEPIGCDSNTGKYLTSAPTSDSGLSVTPTSISSIQEQLFANNSNICLYIDPDVNDMYLMYYTGQSVSSEGSSPAPTGLWTKSAAIKNVPMMKPFRVTLVVDPSFIETYINGELILVSKTPGTSQLYTYPSANINFMGAPEFSTYCRTGNFQYWGQVLPAKSIRLFSSTPAAVSAYTQQ